MLKFRLALLTILALMATHAFAQQYDVLIRNGRVIDGSGNPWTYADVGVIGDRIAFVGHAAAGVTAKRTIDAAGLIVAALHRLIAMPVGLAEQARRRPRSLQCPLHVGVAE